MLRTDIVNIIGRKYLTSNIENVEYSYPKASKSIGVALNFSQSNVEGLTSTPHFLDLRFTNGKISILVETKQDIMNNLELSKKQLAG